MNFLLIISKLYLIILLTCFKFWNSFQINLIIKRYKFKFIEVFKWILNSFNINFNNKYIKLNYHIVSIKSK